MEVFGMGKPLVIGEIHFAQKPQLPSDAKAYVRLLETSMADAPARLVAEAVLQVISEEANLGNPIPFALYGDLQDERGSYTISVLIDLDGDGKVSPGDFINTQSYPVLTFGYPSEVSVRVRQIT
jgi:uncharacterized lipoprotein YbaY